MKLVLSNREVTRAREFFWIKFKFFRDSAFHMFPLGIKPYLIGGVIIEIVHTLRGLMDS
jgi:hypothetical protein